MEHSVEDIAIRLDVRHSSIMISEDQNVPFCFTSWKVNLHLLSFTNSSFMVFSMLERSV